MRTNAGGEERVNGASVNRPKHVGECSIGSGRRVPDFALTVASRLNANGHNYRNSQFCKKNVAGHLLRWEDFGLFNRLLGACTPWHLAIGKLRESRARWLAVFCAYMPEKTELTTFCTL